ncbi:MAG: hypothetical protein HFF89_09020 [Oscillibacter sp.]|jgi:hypothetical protein|nr:hypothetical protein [Oscillibacter sp.]MCI8847876.1 hypothetical protein [Oscillibacter sp.]MCI9375166.1 hypothetical protein [Oscillibacter sp.]
MEASVLLDAHVQLKRIYTVLNECLDLTRQLADAVDRRDEVAIQLLVSMREEPVGRLRRANTALEYQQDALDPEPGRRLGELLKGGEPKDESEAPLAKQVSMNARLLQQVYELDKAVNLKLNREKSIYHSK